MAQPQLLMWAHRMGVTYGQRPSTFLLDPDRLAVALDAAAEAVGRQDDVNTVDEVIRAGTGKVQPVVIVGSVH